MIANTRTEPDGGEAVRGLLARTANPARPNEVDVSRPSDALAAEAAADDTFTGLLLGLGAVALLVGGIGVANTMVISVLERRAEIGLRRSLGATRNTSASSSSPNPSCCPSSAAAQDIARIGCDSGVRDTAGLAHPSPRLRTMRKS
jgi:hypothetical protein